MSETADPYVWVVRASENDSHAGVARHLQFCQHFEWMTKPVVATGDEVASLPPCKSCVAFQAAHQGESMNDATERLATWWWQRKQGIRDRIAERSAI